MQRISRGLRLLTAIVSAVVLAGAAVPAKPFDRAYRAAGYTSAKRARAACERTFGRTIDLPQAEPGVKFTRRFGRCVDAEGIGNDRLEIDYINEDKPMHHYKVTVYRKPFAGFPLKRMETAAYVLHDGTRAVLTGGRRQAPASALFFVHAGMQYVLWADARLAEAASGDALAGVANSLPAKMQPIGGIAYRRRSPTIDELRDRLAFRMFVPRVVPAKWTLELKTYPPGSERISGIRLHFTDERGEHPIVGIVETETFMRRLARRHGAIVYLHGRIGRFATWADSVRFPDGRAVPGGILRWIEDGTLIEMDSSVLTKRQMVRLARDLREAEMSRH